MGYGGWYIHWKKLSTYINNNGMDYESARRVINGSDQKVLIASYAKKF